MGELTCGKAELRSCRDRAEGGGKCLEVAPATTFASMTWRQRAQECFGRLWDLTNMMTLGDVWESFRKQASIRLVSQRT